LIELAKGFLAANQMPRQVTEVINNIKIVNDGNKVTLSVAFKPGPLIKAFKGMQGGFPIGG
jgi:hypothetical protein